MRKWKSIMAAALVAAMATTTVCSVVPVNGITAEAASVRLSKTSLSMRVGQSRQLKVKGTKKTVKWSVSNGKILKVTKNGKVTAKKTGSAKVYAKVSKKRLTCKVKVSKRITTTTTNTLHTQKPATPISQTTKTPQTTTAPGITNYTGQNAINGVRFYLQAFDESMQNEQFVYVNVENYTSYKVYMEPDAYITTDGLNYKARIVNSKNDTYQDNCVPEAYIDMDQVNPSKECIMYDSYDYVMSDDKGQLDTSKYWLPTNANSTMTFYVRMNGNRYRVSVNYSQQGAIYSTIGEEAVLFTEINNSTPAPQESMAPDWWTESTERPSETKQPLLEETTSPTETEQPLLETTTSPMATRRPLLEATTSPTGTEKPDWLEPSEKPEETTSVPKETQTPTTEEPDVTEPLETKNPDTDSIIVAKNETKNVYIDGVKISFIQSDEKMIVKAENTSDESVTLDGSIQFIDVYGEVQSSYWMYVFDIAPERVAYYQVDSFSEFENVLISELQVGKRSGSEYVSDISIDPMEGYGEQATITEKYLGKPENIEYGFVFVEASIVFYDENGNILRVQRLNQCIDESNGYESVYSYECIGAARYEVVLSGTYD